MSTKIYSGLRLLDPSQDMLSLVPAVIAPAIRAEYAILSRKEVARTIARFMAIPDFLESHEPDDTVYFAAEKRWNKTQADLGQSHVLNDPLRFTLSFGKSSEGNILAVPFVSGDNYQQTLKDTGLFEFYGYWDNVDHPEELTKEAWDKRGKEWDTVLNKSGTFGDLAHWTLSTQHMWTDVLMDFSSDRSDTLSLNELYTQEERLKEALIAQVAGVLESNEDVYRKYLRSRDLVRTFAMAPAFAEIERPELLPEDIMAKFKDVPRFQVPNEVIESVVNSAD